MKYAERARVWSSPASAFAGFRFPAEVIVLAVRWYLRYGLSYRDVEEPLAERGVQVDHVTVYRWVQRFTPLLADAARFARHAPGGRWFVHDLLSRRTDELPPAAWHHVEQYANNPIQADHGQLKHRLRSMRGLETDRTAQVVIAGHAFLQNLRRGHYELGVDVRPPLRVAAASAELAQAI